MDWPDRLVPPPRGVIGTRISPATCTVATMSSTRARDDDAERLDLVDAGVGAVEAARGDVEADLAGEVLAQVPGEVVALLLEEEVHANPDRGRLRRGASGSIDDLVQRVLDDAARPRPA